MFLFLLRLDKSHLFLVSLIIEFKMKERKKFQLYILASMKKTGLVKHKIETAHKVP